MKTKDSVSDLPLYVIEREMPGAGKLTAEELKEAARTSCAALEELGDQIIWSHSYVTGDKIFCVYHAANESLIRDHATKAGFPADNICLVENVISPATAELEHA